MKNKNQLLIAILSLSLLFLPACTTTPGGGTTLDAKTVASIAQEATRFGSATVLGIHPEYRPQFEIARDSLKALLAIGSADIAQLTAILKSLPIAEGPQGEIGIIIGQGFISIWGLYGEYVMTLDKKAAYAEWVKPVAMGILAGLDSALLGAAQGSWQLLNK